MDHMRHDLRGPLAAIIGFSELLFDGKLGPLEEKQRECLGLILTSSNQLLDLINQPWQVTGGDPAATGNEPNNSK
jgi:signal transduction histidine kinase